VTSEEALEDAVALAESEAPLVMKASAVMLAKAVEEAMGAKRSQKEGTTKQ
jgi:hypothetical protein